MLFESSHLRITAEHGTATLWFGFPGHVPNALDLAHIRELDEAIQAIAAIPSVQILVVRSSNPAGFCAGIRPEVLAGLTHPSDRASFAWHGQQVFNHLAQLRAVTIAYLDGPCLGAGLELALACDYRLCIASPNTRLGFLDRLTCFGGSSRLRALIGRQADSLLNSGLTISGREASAMKLVDVTCSERRAKMELRSFLDRLEMRPIKPHPYREPTGLAGERKSFAAFSPQVAPCYPLESSLNPIPAFPDTIGVMGDDEEAAQLASEVALRGGGVVVCGNRALIYSGIDATLARGFITPLEAEQARLRVRSSDTLAEFRRTGLVFVAEGHNPFRLATTVLPRVVVCVIRSQAKDSATETYNNRVGHSRDSAWEKLEVFPYPRRVVQIRFCGQNQIALFPSPGIDSDATITLAAWLRPFGREAIFPPSRQPRQQIRVSSTVDSSLLTSSFHAFSGNGLADASYPPLSPRNAG
jgi:enoyl-CoA hydratase